MKCIAPMRLLKNVDLVKNPQGIEVPCGQCMPCRIARRDAWALRLMHESLYWDSCIFLTLTYDEDHKPKNGSLVPNDLTKFFKRLRKAIGKRKIKYFACGDYGDEKDRPHYHVILFGLDFLSEEDRKIIKSCWDLCDWNQLGNKPFGNVTPSSIRYVLKYVESKVVGKESKYAYDEYDILPTYAVMSKGIGKKWIEDNIEKVKKDLVCYATGRKYSIPRYYRKISDIPNEDIVLHGINRESKEVQELTGYYLTRDEAYMNFMPDDVLRLEEKMKSRALQGNDNIEARIKINSRKK